MIYFGVFLLDILWLNIGIFIINDFFVEELENTTFFLFLGIAVMLSNFRIKLEKGINIIKYYKILILFISIFYCVFVYFYYINKLIVFDSIYYQILPIFIIIIGHLYTIFKIEKQKDTL